MNRKYFVKKIFFFFFKKEKSRSAGPNRHDGMPSPSDRPRPKNFELLAGPCISEETFSVQKKLKKRRGDRIGIFGQTCTAGGDSSQSGTSANKFLFYFFKKKIFSFLKRKISKMMKWRSPISIDRLPNERVEGK